jgi:hypothetical protein
MGAFEALQSYDVDFHPEANSIAGCASPFRWYFFLMLLVLFGGGVIGSALGLQLLLWRVARSHVEEDVNEFVRERAGRRVILHVFEHEGAIAVRASLELAEDAPRLELARRGMKPVLAKWVGALAEHPLADPELAGRFVCRVPESSHAFEALGRMKALLLEGAARHDIREVKLDRRSLAIVVARSGRADLDALTDLLAALAGAVQLQGGVLVRGEDALRARCGFCHADLAEEALPTVACELCSTVVHELCWAEHGHCPVLGCKGV